MLPEKSLLFHRAFIYIHFPVLCGPSLSAEEKKSAKMPPQLCPQPSLIAFFNFAHKWPTFAFTDESEYTLGSLRKIAHNGLHGETGGVLGGGGITTLGAFHTVRKPCVAGYQNGKLCRFWGLVVGAPKERREPSGQRCAYACRCPEGVAAPLGCVIFFAFVEIGICTSGAHDFPRVRGGGGITTLGAFHTVRKPCVAVA